jgi:hypothetical protein
MDKQITGLSGEFFVAAELLKRNLQVSLTLGNAKSVDLIAINERASYQVQVKTLRKGPNCFDLIVSKINATHIYIFVYLNDVDQQPDYYIVRGEEILDNLQHYYGKSLLKTRQTVNDTPLRKYKNNWTIFEN